MSYIRKRVTKSTQLPVQNRNDTWLGGVEDLEEHARQMSLSSYIQLYRVGGKFISGQGDLSIGENSDVRFAKFITQVLALVQ